MNNATHESDTLAFLEALTGEPSGTVRARGAWQRQLPSTPFEGLLAALASEFRPIVD